MYTPDYSISTPENVDLHLELAGIGNRILASVLDFCLGALILIVISLLGAAIYFVLEQFPLSADSRNIIRLTFGMIAIFASFFVTICYHIFFEGFWQGQTPGKRVAKIRVIETNGQPVSWASVFIRNIVRVFDVVIVFVGLLVMLINKNEKRLGDLAAGTLVIRERSSNLSTKDIKLVSSAKVDSLLDVGRISPEEYDLLARFLKRRETMADSHRPIVAGKLENYFRRQLGESDGPSERPENESSNDGNDSSAENFLEQVFVSYQARADE